jgi:hypothetical protein
MTPVELIIKALHFLLVVFIIGTPFFGDAYLQTMHLLIVPFIMMHWATNQSVCALTEMEKLATGKTCDEETFFGKVVGPVYKFNTLQDENFFLWTVLITLWLITVFKLHNSGFAYLKHEVAIIRERFA